MTENITVCTSLYKTTNCDIITIDTLKDLIESQSGKIREYTLAIQSSSNSIEKENLKKKLPIVLMNGIFNKRESDGLVDYSSFIIIDLDYKLPDDEVLRDTDWELFKTNPIVRLMFHSPNEGIKLVIRHNNIDPSLHSELYMAIASSLNSPKIDIKCSDLPRAHFISYDPNLFDNPSSEEFNFIPTTTAKIFVETTTTKPTTKATTLRTYFKITAPKVLTLKEEQETIKEALAWSESTFPICKGFRNSHLFKFACTLHDKGVCQQSAIEYLTLKYIASDFRGDEIESVVKSAYK